MKRVLLSVLAIWFAAHTFILSIFAQGPPQKDLPEGVKARLGKGRISEIAYSPDRRHLAVASSLGIWLYDTETYQEVALFAEDAVGSISFSADGQILASGSWDNTIRLWDVETKTFKDTLSGHSDDVLSVVFSPDSSMLASGSRDDTIRLWDAKTGAHLRTLIGHKHSVWSVVFSPDGQTLASGSRDGAVLLWDLTPAPPERKKIAADVNTDGVVNIQDLVLVAANFGRTGEHLADVNEDGVVNILDLTLVAGAIGEGTTSP